MDITQEKEMKNRKHNMKLYPFYEMIGYDVLFYMGIRVMFLSEVKGFNDAQIMLSTTLFALFQIVLQMPVTLIITKIGKRYGAIIGNVFTILWAVVLIFLNNFALLVLSQLLYSIGYAFKYMSEANLLSDSIPESSAQNKIYTNIDKRAFSRYCFLSAISTVIAGYAYNFNKFMPLILSLIFILMTTIISFNFVDIEKKKQRRNKESQEIKKYIKELRQGYRFVINSKRLRALLLFTGLIWGTITLVQTFELLLLQYLGVSAEIIGLIFAGLEMVKAVYSRKAVHFNNVFGNKSLLNILGCYALVWILVGVIAQVEIGTIAKLTIIIFMLVLLAALNSIYQILAKKYFNNFTNAKILPSIYSIKSISDNLFRIITTLIGTLLLSFVNVEIAILITGILLVISAIIVNAYSNNKLGLEPEKYTQKDIYIRK